MLQRITKHLSIRIFAILQELTSRHSAACRRGRLQVALFVFFLGFASTPSAQDFAISKTHSGNFTQGADVCLQDDTRNNRVLLWNSATGDYQFCCGGMIFTGRGTAVRKGNIFTLTHFAANRRVSASVDLSQKKGIASLQSPPGVLKCSITDRDTSNNSCQCAAPAPPVITSFSFTGDCVNPPSITITWASTGGTSAVLEQFRNSLLRSSTGVSTSGSINGALLNNGDLSCGDLLRLVVTGPGGTTSQTLTIQ